MEYSPPRRHRDTEKHDCSLWSPTRFPFNAWMCEFPVGTVRLHKCLRVSVPPW